ncbi:MAG: tetratricopeptide repeat protein [Bacteroidales bacterium]|nr:tetratricopeptide repeat protein [Bacteroidales bacterium]
MAKENLNENAEAVAEAVSKTELFFKENRTLLISILAALVVVCAGFFCWYKFAYQPKKAEALGQMYPAEANFRNMEYELALHGDGNLLGFEQIIEDYGKKAGKAVYFYAGVCELQLGNNEAAISYLRKYNGGDKILAARAIACMGDAYVGLGEYEEALKCFVKAAAKSDNMFSASYLLKAGVVAEELGQDAKALGFYKEIKDKYPQSIEGYDIDKYISRIEAK